MKDIIISELWCSHQPALAISWLQMFTSALAISWLQMFTSALAISWLQISVPNTFYRTTNFMLKIKKREVYFYLHAFKYTYTLHFLLLFAYISLQFITEPISEPASSVGIETRLRERQPGNRDSIPGTGKRLLSRSALGSNQPPTRELGGRGMELTIHDHLTPTLRRIGAASPKFTLHHSVHKGKFYRIQ
jgi:hypothetical protein